MAPHEDNPWAKEAEETQSKQRQSNVKKMTWKPGEHTIRILPSKKKGKLPFVKYAVHWIPVRTGKNDRPLIHAVDYRCPICEFVSQIWGEIYRLKEEEEMTDKSPEVQKLMKQASKLRGKKTYDMNVIHRDDLRDDEGKIKIKRLVAGPTIWKSIIELGNSDKWGNPSAAGDRGYDLTVTVDGEGLKREYTILPDPDRKALTEEEVEALNGDGYDLEALRKFSTAEDILEVLKNAKAPLDSLNLKSVKKSLAEAFGKNVVDDDTSSSSSSSGDDDGDDEDKDVTPPSSDDDGDDEDKDVTPPSSDDDGDDEDKEDEKDPAEEKRKEKEEAAFSADESSEEEPSGDSDGMMELDCHGTYDGDDVGCQDCEFASDCKKLQKTYKSKAEELDIDIEDMSGKEIDKAIKKAEAEAEKKDDKSAGKAGKAGKGKAGKASAGKSGKAKRDLPF